MQLAPPVPPHRDQGRVVFAGAGPHAAGAAPGGPQRIVHRGRAAGHDLTGRGTGLEARPQLLAAALEGGSHRAAVAEVNVARRRPRPLPVRHRPAKRRLARGRDTSVLGGSGSRRRARGHALSSPAAASPDAAGSQPHPAAEALGAGRRSSEPPSVRVRISQPSRVTRMVCSHWADGRRSRVITVHPSGRIFT